MQGGKIPTRHISSNTCKRFKCTSTFCAFLRFSWVRSIFFIPIDGDFSGPWHLLTMFPLNFIINSLVICGNRGHGSLIVGIVMGRAEMHRRVHRWGHCLDLLNRQNCLFICICICICICFVFVFVLKCTSEVTVLFSTIDNLPARQGCQTLLLSLWKIYTLFVPDLMAWKLIFYFQVKPRPF